jgi:hypothetical protein
MNKTILSVIGVIVISIVVSYITAGMIKSGSLGATAKCTDGTATCLPNIVLTGLTGFNSLQVDAGATSLAGDATISGGTLNVTTANAATSTIIGGCFQFYATSTQTPQKFQASTTPGIMYSDYGACPNL